MSDDHSRIARLETHTAAIKETLEDMKLSAMRREEKIDRLVSDYANFETHRQSVCKPFQKRFEDLEDRVRALEAFKWKTMGAIGIITFFANILANKL